MRVLSIVVLIAVSCSVCVGVELPRGEAEGHIEDGRAGRG